MGQKRENAGFVCGCCGYRVEPVDTGSYRNHCPRCLYSRHVDVRPGDRASGCGGLMVPIGIRHAGRKGWQLIHRCENCGATSANRVADGTRQPDNGAALAKLSAESPPADRRSPGTGR